MVGVGHRKPVIEILNIQGLSMNKITPDKHQDGTETVTLYGKTVDVTGKDEFDLFKKHYTVVRETKAKKSDAKSSKAKETPTFDEVKTA